MLRIALFLILFSTGIYAQPYDLTTLPTEYSFVSRDATATATVRYLGRQGELFLFDEHVENTDGSKSRSTMYVNRQSQTVMFESEGEAARFTPHDCIPGVGVCHYIWETEESRDEMRTISHLQRDVYITEEFYRDGEEWIFWIRSCTTFDEYGFWIDFYRYYGDGEVEYGERVHEAPSRLTELKALCNRAPLLS